MEPGTLLSHVDTDLVTREQLASVETPDATRSFKPVPHIELIETLEHVLRLNQIAIRKEQFALRRDGATLFGVLQLAYQDTPDGMAALGMRTSRDCRCSSATTWSSAGT
jgi:microcystin degradation protein MlrC